MQLILDTKEQRVQDLQEAIDSAQSWKDIYAFAKDRVDLSSPSYKYYSEQYQQKSLQINELKIKLHRLNFPMDGRY